MDKDRDLRVEHDVPERVREWYEKVYGEEVRRMSTEETRDDRDARKAGGD